MVLSMILPQAYNVLDPYENGRGTTLSDVLYRGQLDIVSGNWDGEHQNFCKKRKNIIKTLLKVNFKIPSKIRTDDICRF